MLNLFSTQIMQAERDGYELRCDEDVLATPVARATCLLPRTLSGGSFTGPGDGLWVVWRKRDRPASKGVLGGAECDGGGCGSERVRRIVDDIFELDTDGVGIVSEPSGEFVGEE